MKIQKNDFFSGLVERFERLVYTVCFQMIHDSSAAEDLMQETFLSVYLHMDDIPAGYEKQWITRIAVNKAKDYLQSAYNRHTVFPGDDALSIQGHAPPTEELAVAGSEIEEIAALIHGLRQPYRPVCELCLLREQTPEEAAAALGRPVKTIHTQLARGKKILREQLERRAENESVSV